MVPCECGLAQRRCSMDGERRIQEQRRLRIWRGAADGCLLQYSQQQVARTNMSAIQPSISYRANNRGVVAVIRGTKRTFGQMATITALGHTCMLLLYAISSLFSASSDLVELLLLLAVAVFSALGNDTWEIDNRVITKQACQIGVCAFRSGTLCRPTIIKKFIFCVFTALPCRSSTTHRLQIRRRRSVTLLKDTSRPQP